MHFPLGFKNVFCASSIAFFISPTPAVTAFNFVNLYLVVLLITLARDVLFWEPKVPLSEGLDRTIEYFAN